MTMLASDLSTDCDAKARRCEYRNPLEEARNFTSAGMCRPSIEWGSNQVNKMWNPAIEG